MLGCCISFDSYIKPQHNAYTHDINFVVYLLIPTSNHNLKTLLYFITLVVYLLIPTSNHNFDALPLLLWLLYIFWFLHQTTTFNSDSLAKERCISFDSYIKPQPLGLSQDLSRVVYLLIPTSNHNKPTGTTALLSLYIFWFLHQTTTISQALHCFRRCISFDSYIKPQPLLW